MTTQVYYRRWRPRRFSELVGQEAVSRTLMQAIARQRIAHAYLFCGPRGTGKTSTARILAKAVNCLNPQDGEPCNACHICNAVSEGRAVDLIEIDAASNRGIDEVRNIREKVHYAPAEAKYKVYVLDEAHMLTDAAADALLKTLEEPPQHVIFVLATTEPHKLPSTVVSRCQRFDFRRIAPAVMVERLAMICAAEGIETDLTALHAIARQAAGSLRDAENLLEQVVTSFGSPVRVEQLNLLLGLTADDRVRALVAHMLQGRVPEALMLLNAVAVEGKDLRQLHRQMVEETREMLLIKSGARQMVAQPPEVVEAQASAVAQVPIERLFRLLRVLGQVAFRYEAPPALPLELAIVECAQEPSSTGVVVGEREAAASMGDGTPPGPLHPSASHAPHPAPPVERRATPVRSPSAPQPPRRVATPAVAHAESVSAPVEDPAISGASPLPTAPREIADGATAGAGAGDRLAQEWDGVIKKLSRRKGRRFNLGALLRGCSRPRLEGSTLELSFTHRSHMERMKEEMDNPESRRIFVEAVSSALGINAPMEVSFSAPDEQEARNTVLQSPLVQTAIGMGGKIVKETEEPDE